MAEENGVATQVNEIPETNTQDVQSNLNSETQIDSTSQQVDTDVVTKATGSELGLEKKAEQEESSESLEDTSESINSLINSALNDELTDEQKQILEDSGLLGHFEMIVNGHRAMIEKNDAEIVGIVGGKEAYSELQEWAVSHLDDSEIESFNRAVLESGDIGLAKLAVEGLQARYLRVNGQAPNKVLEAGETSNHETRPYSNRDEYIRETMSMKYRQNPEYAAIVEAKRNASGF